MKILKFIGKWTLVIVISTSVALLMLEIVYRYQWFDFYETELQGLNKDDELSGTNNILVAGDSYTATPDSYVDLIRLGFRSYSVVNTASPGTGIIQASYVLPERIETFKPKIFVYQIYVGNDLLDITHPTSSDSISFSRKAYWYLSDHLHSLAYINYKLGGAAQQPVNDLGKAIQPSSTDSFSVAGYTNREKLQFKAEPKLIENSLYLENGRSEDMDLLCERLHEITADLPEDCKVYFIIIPHASQVSKRYYGQMTELGSDFSRPVYSETDFPFTEKIKTSFPDVTIIDPLPEFRLMEATGLHLYYQNDPHLSPLGQKVLGTLAVKTVILGFK